MIRRPPRSTRVRSSAASDVYKRQGKNRTHQIHQGLRAHALARPGGHMPDSEDEQWSRISAEAELRPEHGVVADVPPALITPEPDDEPLFDPIELNEVPLLEGEVPEGAETEPESDAALPIQIVPFQAGPVAEAGPDVI